MGWGNTLKAVNMDFNHVTRAYLNENHTERKWKLKGDIHEQYGATLHNTKQNGTITTNKNSNTNANTDDITTLTTTAITTSSTSLI